MKTRLLFVLAVLACLPLAAQVSSNLSFFQYRSTPQGQVVDSWLQGRTVSNITARLARITDFKMESFRDGKQNQVQFIAEAPDCYYDAARFVAWDAGHIELFTPQTNLFIEGDGFYFLQTNRILYLSNNVETHILRSMLRSPLLGSSSTNNAAAASGQMVKVFSDRCEIDNQSNRVDYSGHVHVIDTQTDMRADFMSVQMTTNGGIRTIHAWANVVINPTNRGEATGKEAFYYVTTNAAMMELAGGAFWTNGLQWARAEKFTYDSTHRFLVAEQGVEVQWPGATNDPAAGVRRLFADYATLQLPPTNGPVERMEAIGHVVITNQSDHSRSTSERALYIRAGDSFELTGHPVWQTDKINVAGDTLTAEMTNKLYHSQGRAHLRLKVNSPADRWVDVTSATLDYQTNLAVFHDHVHGQLFESNRLRDALDCDHLRVTLVSNQVETAVARGSVRGRTAPDAGGIVKTISCQTLTVNRTPATGLLKKIRAEGAVVITDYAATAKGTSNVLRSDLATARFAATTNQLEEAVAEKHVVIDQTSATQMIHGTAERADYVTSNDTVTLTGDPVGRNARYKITDADFMAWHPKGRYWSASGPFQISPLPTNTVSARR